MGDVCGQPKGTIRSAICIAVISPHISNVSKHRFPPNQNMSFYIQAHVSIFDSQNRTHVLIYVIIVGIYVRFNRKEKE